MAESPFGFLQASMTCDHPPSSLADPGPIRSLCETLAARFDGEPVKWCTGTDRNGIDSFRTRKRFDPELLRVDESMDSHSLDLSYKYHRFLQPLLDVSVSSRGDGYRVQWAVRAPRVPEALYVETVERQVEQLLASPHPWYGLAGPSDSSQDGRFNTPIREWLPTSSEWVDLAVELPGVHWLQLIGPELIGGGQRADLGRLGARIVDGRSVTLLQIADRPSDVTDELVLACEEVLSDRLMRMHKRPPDWWRTLGRDINYDEDPNDNPHLDWERERAQALAQADQANREPT